MARCQPYILRAEDVMKRKQSRDLVNANTYSLNKVEFFQARLPSVEDALAVERANFCMERCKLPVDIIKRVLSSNLKEVSNNIDQCTKQTSRKIDKQSGQVEIDFDQAAVCLEKNIEIMQVMNTKINIGLKDFKEEYMV